MGLVQFERGCGENWLRRDHSTPWAQLAFTGIVRL